MTEFILGSGLLIPEKCMKCKYNSYERFEKCNDCEKRGVKRKWE